MGLEFELCSQGCHDRDFGALLWGLESAAPLWPTANNPDYHHRGVGTSMDCGQQHEACGDYFYLGTNACGRD